MFLLDDHELVRGGVRDVLSREDDITVVGEAGTAEDALELIPQTKPDVAVLDVRLGDRAGGRAASRCAGRSGLTIPRWPV